MKRIIPFLILFFFLMPGCRNDQSRQASMGLADDQIDTTFYPLFIDGGAKLVFQVGHLTPDKGLKLYYDTIYYPTKGLMLDDSLRHRLSTQ